MQGQEVEGILSIDNNQARTWKVVLRTETPDFLFVWFRFARLHKASEACESMEVRAVVESNLNAGLHWTVRRIFCRNDKLYCMWIHFLNYDLHIWLSFTQDQEFMKSWVYGS